MEVTYVITLCQSGLSVWTISLMSWETKKGRVRKGKARGKDQGRARDSAGKEGVKKRVSKRRKGEKEEEGECVYKRDG